MKCLRIYADETGESHLTNLDIPLVPIELFPGVPPIYLSAQHAASSVRFVRVPPGIPEVGWHVTPVRQLAILLTGWVEFETSDGEKRCCEAGAVVLAEDTFRTGHISRGPDDGQFLMFVPVPDGLSGKPIFRGHQALDFIH
jgi:hypothetical protein